MSANAPSQAHTTRPAPNEPRRGPAEGAGLPLRLANLQLWPDFQVFVSGARVDFTRREFEVLYVLAARPGELLSKQLIHGLAWRSPRFHARDRSVDVYLRKLRLKLGALAPGWRYIHTHHGLGYRFEPQPIDE